MGNKTHRNTSLTVHVRYAPYIEAHHSTFLDVTHSEVLAAVAVSPYSDYVQVDTDEAFFGIGRVISDFPSLYDVFGKFMSGFDIEVIWDSIFGNLMSELEMNEAIASRMKLIDDDVIKSALPNLYTRMRNLNSVMTSSFVISKAMVESARVKMLSSISSEIKFPTISDIKTKYRTSLNWTKSVVTSYAEAMKLFYAAGMVAEEVNYKFKAINILWPFTVTDFERAALAALQGTVAYQKVALRRGRSVVSKVLLVGSYAVTGLLVGTSIAPGIGTVIGAIVGFIVGIAMILLE